MTRRKPTPEAEQPHLAPLKIEGQPWHPDPEVMDRLSELDATDPLPQPDSEGMDDRMAITHPFVWTEIPSTDHWTHDDHTTTQDDHTTNPYLLESSKILSDLAAESHRAQLTIDALDKEIEHLTADADFQIRRIEARRDAELAQRTARVDDLMKIVSANTIVNGGKDQTNDPQ